MDQFTLILEIALIEENATNVAALAYTLLGKADKNYRNNYNVNTHCSNLVEVEQDNKKINIIESKSAVGDFIGEEIQLKAHMASGGK